jgi:hypothetical protein
MASIGEGASPIAKGFVAQYSGQLSAMPHLVAIALLLSEFLIVFWPLSTQPKK